MEYLSAACSRLSTEMDEVARDGWRCHGYLHPVTKGRARVLRVISFFVNWAVLMGFWRKMKVPDMCCINAGFKIFF